MLSHIATYRPTAGGARKNFVKSLSFCAQRAEFLEQAASFAALAQKWTLTALPLFIWMGEILFKTRLSEDLFTGLSPWVQKLPGRLLHVNVLGCGVFAAVSGSSAATTATIGRISLPELKQRGYPCPMGRPTRPQPVPTFSGADHPFRSAWILPTVREAGIDPVWFGIYLVLVVESAQLTPPVGFNLHVIQGLTNRGIIEIARYSAPAFLMILIVVTIISIWPGIALYLPHLAFQ